MFTYPRIEFGGVDEVDLVQSVLPVFVGRDEARQPRTLPDGDGAVRLLIFVPVALEGELYLGPVGGSLTLDGAGDLAHDILDDRNRRAFRAKA